MRGTYLAGAVGTMLVMTAHALYVESILLDPRYSNTVSESTAYITNYMTAEGIESASLALVDSNRVVWFGCFGYENRELGIPVSTATVFRIGSVSKVFTTFAALQLCDQGIISLTTTVRQCLPDFSVLPRTNYPSSDTITLRHLVGYHSGLPGDLYRLGDTTVPFDGYASLMLSYLPTTYPISVNLRSANAADLEAITLVAGQQDVVSSCCVCRRSGFQPLVTLNAAGCRVYVERQTHACAYNPLKLTPMTTYPLYPPDLVNSYCNAGFSLTHCIVGQMNTSGVSFVTYCNQNIFTPLDMHSTSYVCDKPAISNHLAVGYHNGVAMPPEYCNAYGSGGMYSTPGDMAQFLMAILAGGMGPHGRVLSSASLAAMLAPQGTNLPLNIENLFVAGLGWDSVVNPRLNYAGRVCFKTGGVSLFSAYMEALPDQQLAAAFVLTDPASRLSMDGSDYLLRRAVRDKAGLPVPPNTNPVSAPPVTAPPALLAAAEGIYADKNGVSMISATNGTLTWLRNVTMAPIAVTGLVFRTNGWFSSPGSQDTEIRFTNLAGRAVLVQRDIFPDRSFIHQHLSGERVTPPAFTAVWSNRLNRTWPLLDEHADGYYYTADNLAYCMMLRSAGACIILHEFMNDAGHVIMPDNDTTAFVASMVDRSDGALRYHATNGLALAQFGGSYYLDPDTISVMDLNSSTSGAVVLDYASAFYAVDLASNAACEALVTMAPSTFHLAVLDDACFQIGATNAGAVLPLIAPHAGRYYLKVQATTSGPSTGSFVLSLQVPEPGVMLALLVPVAAMRLFTNTTTRRCE